MIYTNRNQMNVILHVRNITGAETVAKSINRKKQKKEHKCGEVFL